MSSRVSVPSVYTVKGGVGSGNLPNQLNTNPKSNRYEPKDITSYFGASDFLLRMFVTTKLQYAFNKNTTIQYITQNAHAPSTSPATR